MKIPIAAIRRLTLHDGPGTRTTVFVKGCPLHCRWCHNPECLSAPPQLLFHDNLCVGCGKCATVCTEGCHSVSPRTIDRSRCRLCGWNVRFVDLDRAHQDWIIREAEGSGD